MKTFKAFFSITLLSIAFLFNNLQAQVNVQAGIMTGINFAGIGTDEESFDNSSLVGMGAAAILELKFGRIALQSEVAYIQKGFKFDILGAKYTNRMNYLEIPVLIKYDFSPVSEYDLQLYAGPTFGFLTSHKQKLSGNGTSMSVDLFADEDYNSSDVGIVLGGTVRVKAGPGKFALDIRLGSGLTPAFKSEGSGADDDLKLVNKNTTITVGYVFPLTSN